MDLTVLLGLWYVPTPCRRKMLVSFSDRWRTCGSGMFGVFLVSYPGVHWLSSSVVGPECCLDTCHFVMLNIHSR